MIKNIEKYYNINYFLNVDIFKLIFNTYNTTIVYNMMIIKLIHINFRFYLKLYNSIFTRKYRLDKINSIMLLIILDGIVRTYGR